MEVRVSFLSVGHSWFQNISPCLQKVPATPSFRAGSPMQEHPWAAATLSQSTPSPGEEQCAQSGSFYPWEGEEEGRDDTKSCLSHVRSAGPDLHPRKAACPWRMAHRGTSARGAGRTSVSQKETSARAQIQSLLPHKSTHVCVGGVAPWFLPVLLLPVTPDKWSRAELQHEPAWLQARGQTAQK